MGRFSRFVKVVFIFTLFALCPACSKSPRRAPLNYDMHISKLPRDPSKAMICFHGMGGDYKIINYVKESATDDSTLISFNFPDYGIRVGEFDPEETFMGTIDELLPAIYVLKQAVYNDRFKTLSLYGFSAGGGAVINTLMVLNTNTYDKRLEEMGVSKKDKKKILKAIQRGQILLDAPLKSVAEIKAFRSPLRELEIVGARFEKNQMEPIDNISKLKGLKLDIIVNFQNPDEVLSNRDDLLYVERLKEVNNKGSTRFVIQGEGHSLPHPHLWELHRSSL